MTNSLTVFEAQLVTDPQVLIAKNTIISKIYVFFGHLAEVYKEEISGKIAGSEKLRQAKISRGENYRGLPYVVLDFPAQFSKEDLFAIRSFFWWGNFFSITLHLAGKYRQHYFPAIKDAINNKYFSDWYICVAQSQWQYHFEPDNYLPIGEGLKYSVDQLPFLKLAKKLPLQKWDEKESFFTENFNLLVKILSDHAPIL